MSNVNIVYIRMIIYTSFRSNNDVRY